MGMDALGALRLADERKKDAWESFMKGLDSVGNLDTYLKDRNLTDGSTRPGVFGGSVWKMWTKPKPEEADASANAGDAQKQGIPWLTKPELADVHRWAKLRGLNHDQATIDEKTSRPERDREHDLKVATTEFDLKKSAWDKLAQEQTQVRTRLNGNIAALPNYYAQLTASANAQEQEQLKQVINFLESQVKADNGTLEEIEAKMDSHNAPDYYIRRKRGEFGAQGEPKFETTEDKLKYAKAAETLLNGNTDMPDSSNVLAYAKENNLNPDQLAKSVAATLANNRGNKDYRSGTAETNLGIQGKGLSNKAAEENAKSTTAATQKKIASLQNSSRDLSNFIANPTYANFKIVEKSLGKYNETGGDLSKMPYVGNLIKLFQDTDEKKFNDNKAVILNDARNTISELNAELNVLAPSKSKKTLAEAKL